MNELLIDRWVGGSLLLLVLKHTMALRLEFEPEAVDNVDDRLWMSTWKLCRNHTKLRCKTRHEASSSQLQLSPFKHQKYMYHTSASPEKNYHSQKVLKIGLYKSFFS